MEPSIVKHCVQSVRLGRSEISDDFIVVESPLEIQLVFGPTDRRSYRTLSITMRTPSDDDSLALGFLYGEGLIQKTSDVLKMEVDPASPNRLQVHLHPDHTIAWESLERHFYASSSCGVCGKTSLESIEIRSHWTLPFPNEWGPHISHAELQALPEGLGQRQSNFQKTGGLHACAIFDSSGQLACLAEDVGRHNALDKIVGAQFSAKALPLRDCGLLLSGRVSFELMQKSLMAGIAFVAAIGAPSSLAIELATKNNMTLVGFLKNDRFNIYSGSQRLENTQNETQN